VPDNEAQGQLPQQDVTTAKEFENGTEGTLKTVLRRFTGSGNRQQQQPSLKSKNVRLQKRGTSEKRPTIPLDRGNIELSRHSLAPSSMSRFSRLVPRMELFQEVMRDELLYTTFITSTCVVVAVLAMIGVNFQNGLSVTGWIVLNWGIISLLAIHSFGRVVHRHERDALLQHPVTCTKALRIANAIAKKDQTTRQRALSGLETPPRARIASTSNESSHNDPFADPQALEKENPFHSPLDDQDFSSEASMLRVRLSDASSTGPSYLLHPQQELDFPTSNLSTPVVAVTNAEFARQQGFSRSWIVSATNSDYSWKSFHEDAVT